MNNLTIATLSELKTYCQDNNIEVTGDKRKKQSFIDAIKASEIENCNSIQSENPVAFTNWEEDDDDLGCADNATDEIRDAWVADLPDIEPDNTPTLILPVLLVLAPIYIVLSLSLSTALILSKTLIQKLTHIVSQVLCRPHEALMSDQLILQEIYA